MHNNTTVFVSFITLLVLYADDLRIVFLQKDQDIYVDIVLVVCVVIFFLEGVFSTIALTDYLWSFFFWLDLISLLSMPLDIYFIMKYISGESESVIQQTDDASNVARVGRASKVGTRAGRFVKLVKLIRIVKVAKFFKQTDAIQKKREHFL